MNWCGIQESYRSCEQGLVIAIHNYFQPGDSLAPMREHEYL